MDLSKLSPCLVIIGFLITLSSAANTCNTSIANETEICTTKTTLDFTDLCKLTFKQYVCASASDLSMLPENFIVMLSSCYTNTTLLALDPGLPSLLFSKLDSNKVKRILASMDTSSSTMSAEYKAFLMNGIQSLTLQDLNAKNSSSWVEPFYILANATLIQCLESQNATCEIFQKLIKGLGQNYNSMPVSKRQELYPAIKTFLSNQKNKTGSGCAVNVSAGTWVVQNFGSFSQMAELNDFSALYSNFSALDVLPLLTLSQLANFSLDPSLMNKTGAYGLIVGTLKNKSDVSGFLTNLNAILGAKNQTSLPPALSQVLLNRTFLIIATNLTSYNNTEWIQLFQNQLSLVLPEVTVDQLSVINQLNISCPFFQAVVKGLSDQFPKLNPEKQQQVYKSFIKPYLTQKGSACAANVNSSTWIKQNLGNFSQTATFSEITTLNSNFSALDALSSLTLQQVAGFAVNSGVGNTTASSSIIVGTLKNKTDVVNFMTYLNDALSTGNQNSLSPALSQALFNKTFQVLGNNISAFNSSDWSQLLTNQLNITLTQVTADQLSLVPQNITCDSYHAVIQAFNTQSPSMTVKTKQQFYTSFIKPYLSQKGSGCAVNVSASTWVVQNFGNFSQVAELSDFSALNPNFTALEVLPLLTISQLVNASVDPSLVNKTDAFGLIVGMLKNKSDVYGFLTNLNATIGAKNQTSLPPALSQALLNKTFQLLAANLTSFNNTEWSQLFQNQLSLVLPEVTADQLSVVPPNISCPFFQAVVKGLSDQFPKLKPDKQQQIYKSLIKPYLTQKGSGCTEQVHSSTWISQNLGSFSPIPTFAEITTFNSNFSALDALSSLTPQQVASFAVNSDAGNSSVSSNIIMGTLQNKTDVLNFMTYLNDALTSKNQTSLPPALSQACLNTTFQILAANLTFFNNTEWSQVFQSQLSFVLPEITSNQLSTIPQNISCPFFQAVIKDLSGQFLKLTKDKQQQIFKSFIKPFLTQKGSACAANVNSSTWISQNLGNFSQIPTFAELNTLNANFNALDAIPSLTLQQVAGFAVNSSAVNNAASSSIVVGALKNKTDVFNFITYLNDAFSTGNQNSLSPDLSQALFNKTFQVIGNNISAFNSSDWSQLLMKQLNITLIQVTADQLSLIPQNISCDSYHVVIQAFTAQLQNMTVNTQKQVYSSFIKPYLTQKGGKVTCYNQTEANSSAWFVTNMGSFFTHTSDTDLGLFANESTQQLFASDPACMQLASQLDLGKDNSMYYTSLLTSSSGFSLSSLPDKFLCSLSPSAIKNMNSNAAIGLIKKINKQCHNPSSGSAAPAPTPEQIEVATPLVSKLENISSSTLNDLGASAVGLSQTQINSVKDSDLVTSLSSLSNVTGWNIQQCKVIVRKALNGNFKVENMESLGSLASGLPSSKVQELSSTQVANALKNPQFANHLSSAPSCLKSVFASKLVGNYNTPSTLVNNIPSSLASFIPKSSLNYKSEKPVIQDLINKEWTSDQAAMFFDQVAASETNFTQFSSSVLQGFTCSTPSKLNDSQVKSLAKAMLTQNTLLEEQQLNCLSRQVIKSGIPTDLDKYPKEILWFISSSNYTMGGCVDYFTVVGQSNISILTKGSELRSRLLTQALTCMNVTSTSLTDNHVKVLGQLACDLNATYIENGPSSLLTQLSQCGSFTTVQQNSIGAVIAKGTTVYGQPSKWTRETMTSLGSLNGCLGKSTLNSIPKKAIQSWMKDAFQSSKLSRKQCASMVSSLTPTRRRRAAGCDTGNEITASNVQNVLLPLLYTVEQLDACLNSSVLVDYLPVLSLMPFTDEQLAVMKKKLDQAYPNGYPESVIPDLGAISFLCTESDIAKWNISSVDTLEGLISPGPPNNTAKLYISKYVDTAKSINGPALNVIGNQYICLLTSAQLNLITATAISEAKPLSISNCNQTVKDALYLKANTSFQSTASQPLAYYNLMKSYLGGAPAADLKNLATKNVSMDIGTFIGLNPEALKGLSVDDVKGLLGTNVVDLKANQDNSVVSAWIKLQKQSDLDRLGLGLQGGIRDVSQTSTVSTISSTTMTTRTNSAPPRGTVLGYSVFLCVVLAVLFS